MTTSKKWWETTGWYVLNHSLINLSDVGRYVPIENIMEIPPGIKMEELISLLNNDGLKTKIEQGYLYIYVR